MDSKILGPETDTRIQHLCYEDPTIRGSGSVQTRELLVNLRLKSISPSIYPNCDPKLRQRQGSSTRYHDMFWTF